MNIIYLGHAGFKLNGKQGSVTIDPFIGELPNGNISFEQAKADLILVSHGHSDHMADAAKLAEMSQGTVVSNLEIANYHKSLGVQAHGMQLGGFWDFGFAQVKMTIAFHSSSTSTYPATYLGNPGGFLVFMDGLTIYHAGDTALFSDMALIGRLHPIDVALLPIGDNFTMGPEDALEAVKMLHPKYVIPMHYNTWDIIKQDPASFARSVENKTPAKVVMLEPGEEYEVLS